MRVAFITLGCKVNSYETDAICDLFVKRGAFIVDSSNCFDADKRWNGLHPPYHISL